MGLLLRKKIRGRTATAGIVAIAASTIMSGCYPIYYAPNIHNVPMLEEKGDVSMAFSLSASEYIGGTEYQAAFSPVDHLGVIVNHISTGSGTDNNLGEGKFTELGVGTYFSLDRDFHFEAYGGFGRGEANNNSEVCGWGRNADGSDSAVRFNKFFTQAVIVRYARDVHLAVSVRMARLHFDDVEKDRIPSYNDECIDGNSTSYLFEPALMARMGPKHMKFMSQIGWSVNLNNPKLAQEDISLSIGLYFHFNVDK